MHHVLVLDEAIDITILLAYVQGLLLRLLLLQLLMTWLRIGHLFLELACIIAAMAALGITIGV